MADIMPIRSMPPQAAQQGWVWDGSTWVWDPQATNPIWPPNPMPCPPPQQCGPMPVPPSCFSQVAKANACWDQSQALYNLVSKVVTDIFATNPGIIPAPPPSAGSGPIHGVTDGSNAQPGDVGEFFQVSPSFTFAAYPNNTTTTVSAAVLQPGDWNLASALSFGVAVGPVSWALSPVPPGLSNAMNGYAVDLNPNVTFFAETGIITGFPARASVSVPTLLAFSVNVGQSALASLTAGTGYLILEGRRAR